MNAKPNIMSDKLNFACFFCARPAFARCVASCRRERLCLPTRIVATAVTIMLHAASQSNLTDSVLGGSLLVCFEEAKFRRQQRPAPSALHLQQQPLQHRATVRVTQPMRNSAPSRLQNLDDFYLADGCYRVTKTRSLTDLFTQRERNADRRCCLTGGPTRGDAACPGPESEIEPLQNVTGDNLKTSADDESNNGSDESDSAVEPSDWNFQETRHQCDELITARVSAVLRDENDVFERVDDVIADDAEPCTPTAAAVGESISMCEVQLSFDVDVCQMRRHTLAEIRTADSNLNNECQDNAQAMSSERVAAAERSWTTKTTTTSCHHSVARSYSEGSWKSKAEPASDGPRGRPKLRRRKSVHFADTKGFELEIKIPFCKELDEDITPPRLLEALQKIRAEMQGNNNDSLVSPTLYTAGALSNHISCFTLSPQFRQPFLEPSFQQRVSGQLVCLESVAVTPNSLSVTGIVRVVNIEFEKQVIIRYTTDGWRSYDDIPACFVGSLPECNQDQFSFHLVAPPSMIGGGQIQLAVQYRLQRTNREYWDNNFARNYVIKYLQHVTARSDDAMMT